MGCAQGKYPVNSPPKGLQKLKMENGYVGKAELAARRRSSTGQRCSGKPLPRNSSASGGDSCGSGGDRRLSDTDGARVGSDGVEDSNKVVQADDDEVIDGWPRWLIVNVSREVLAGLVPKSAENYDKLDKVGQGTYSNVYKARDRKTGKIVALKKVRFDTSEPESVKFMAREIMIVRKLDHPNVVKLEGLATSRMNYSLYLVFDFMQTDLASIICRPEERLTEPQVKCYMYQLLSGLQHCHERGILHRDIKGSNLLIDKSGMLKIADFGLAKYYSPNNRRPLTSRVVTLWYRAPELLLGTTDYGVGIDLWSAGCLLAEMFAGRPIMPGRTEVEQLHRIFKLCGTPSEDYWKKQRLSTTFRPPQSYRPRIFEAFSEFPESSLGLLTTLLALDPSSRGSASSALQNEFFHTSPLACDLSGLPVIWKEEDEIAEANERRKLRNRKLKQRARTQRQHRKKELLAEQSKEASDPKDEEPEKTNELNIQRQEPAVSTSSSSSSSSGGSSSSGTKFIRQLVTRPLMPSPVTPVSQQILSPKTQGHPNANKNFKNLPPLPASRAGSIKHGSNNNNMDDYYVYRYGQVQRSASTREFRKFDQSKTLELYAVDD